MKTILLYLALLVASAGYHGSEAKGHKGTIDEYDDYKGLVSCGCHYASSCRKCGTHPHLCNGDCAWSSSGCHPKVADDLELFVDPMTVFNIATFVIGQIEFFTSLPTDHDHQEVMEKLNDIKKITANTQNGVMKLVNSVNFLDQQILLTQAQTKILSHFNEMSDLIRFNANKTLWGYWAYDVIDGNGGSASALSIINTQITNNNIIAKYKKKLESDGSITRTVAGSIADFFKLQVIYQMLGFKTLEKANKILHQCSSMNFDYKVMVHRFNKQIQQSRNVSASFAHETHFLRNNGWENKNYLRMWDVPFAHLHPVEADEGHVVTGVQLYKYGNRMAIKIKQGILQEFGIIVNETWKNASGWGEKQGVDYVQVWRGLYIDLHNAYVPNGKALMGISFFIKKNRLSIKVQAAPVDYFNGKVSRNTEWIEALGWGQKYYNPNDYPYVDTWEVETIPSSMLTGAGLYLKHNRMALQIRDVFEPLSKGQGCSTGAYPDVKFSGTNSCCDGFPYFPNNKEASQSCPHDGNGPKYNCTGK